MNRSGLIAGVLLVGVGAVGFAAWRYLPIYRAEQAVKAQLRDPDSARFTHVGYSRASGGVCGYVNAKNALGGYVGGKLFIVDSDGAVEFEPLSYERSDPKAQLASLREQLAFYEKGQRMCNTSVTPPPVH